VQRYPLGRVFGYRSLGSAFLFSGQKGSTRRDPQAPIRVIVENGHADLAGVVLNKGGSAARLRLGELG